MEFYIILSKLLVTFCQSGPSLFLFILMKPETSVKSVSEESGCDKKEEDVLEEVMRAKTSCLTNSQRDVTMLKAQSIKCWKLMQLYKGV